MRFAAATINGKTVSLLGIDPAAYQQVASLTFQEGDSQTAFQEMAGGRVLIANGVLASQLQLKVGDFVQLATPRGMQSYRIAAVAGDYLNAKVMTAYISQDNLQKDFRKSEDILYQLNINPGADPAQVEVSLERMLEDYPQFNLVSGRKYFEENKEIFNSIFVFYGVLLALMSAPSLIAMLNTLSIGVIERTREIGMLRAIGASQKQVRRMVLAESLLLAAIGTTFGLAAGLYLGYVMVLGLSSGGFPIAYVFPVQGLLAGIVTGLGFGVLAALLPARQAAGIEIVDALHYE
jgi:putative ABC transport system permease protein